MILLHFDATITDTVHVHGVGNTVYDDLSRNLSANHVGVDSSLQLHLSPDHPVNRNLQLYNPTLSIDTPDDHFFLSSAVISLLTSCLPLQSLTLTLHHSTNATHLLRITCYALLSVPLFSADTHTPGNDGALSLRSTSSQRKQPTDQELQRVTHTYSGRMSLEV